MIARKSEIEASKGNSHSLSLDVHAQWATMEKTGQWRFTPPTHAVAAFIEALRLHKVEGGIDGRLARYSVNRDVMVSGMRSLGFETLLKDRWLSPIIVTFFKPGRSQVRVWPLLRIDEGQGLHYLSWQTHRCWTVSVSAVSGRMDASVMRRVPKAASEVLTEMGVASAAPPAEAIIERAKLTA